MDAGKIQHLKPTKLLENNVNSESEPFHCPICPIVCVQKRILRLHLIIEHGQNLKDSLKEMLAKVLNQQNGDNALNQTLSPCPEPVPKLEEKPKDKDKQGSKQVQIEDLKSQDIDLGMEVTKEKLAKKLRGLEKDKTTGPKQATKDKKMLTLVIFLFLAGLLLAGKNRGLEQKLEKSNQVIANVTKQIETLLMEKTKLEPNLDSLNETIAEKPDEFDSETNNSWAWDTLKEILKAILIAILSLLPIFSILAILVKFDCKPNGDDRLYLQIQNLVKGLVEPSDNMLSMTNQNLKPFLNNSIDVKNDSGSTNLHNASRYGRTDQVRILLKLGADVHIKNADDQNALHLAVTHGHVEVAKLLLQNGAFVNSMDEKLRTPLHLAKTAEMAELLLQNGADFEARNDIKSTPLMEAANFGYIKVAEKLIQIGVDVDAENEFQKTALKLAVSQGHLNVVEKLIQSGVAINAKDKFRNTALMCAAVQGHPEIVSILLKNGAKVNPTLDDPWSPLHAAALRGFSKVVEILLKHGARKDLVDNFNRTPLNVAEECKNGDYKEVIALLK